MLETWIYDGSLNDQYGETFRLAGYHSENCKDKCILQTMIVLLVFTSNHNVLLRSLSMAVLAAGVCPKRWFFYFMCEACILWVDAEIFQWLLSASQAPLATALWSSRTIWF